jgi:cytochrome bd-type quinol oxidase subunit 2
MEGSSVSTQVATKAEPRQRARRSSRALAVLAIGPAAALVGLAWAVVQPYRITMLDPTGQGFWWLLAQPPLYVIAAGLFFHLVIAPGVVADLEDDRP